MEWNFPTAIVVVLLIISAVFALDGYFRRLYTGCAQGGNARQIKYPYRMLLRIEGLRGKKSARQVEEALGAIEGVRAHVDLLSGQALILMKTPVSPELLLGAVAGAGCGARVCRTGL